MASEPSDDDDGYDDGYDFMDPLDDLKAERQRCLHPRVGMSDAELRLHRILEEEAQRAVAKQVDHDAALAQQLMLDEAREGAERAAAAQRNAFARRFRCCMFLFDLSELQDFCDWWSGPYGSLITAPMQHFDRRDAFHKTRLHAYDGDASVYGTDKLNGKANQEYKTYVNTFRRKTGTTWGLECRMPCIEASQLLMAHVQLYWVQKRNVANIKCVVDYAYGGAVGGVRADMLREAGEWLFVLHQLCFQTGILHALGGEAVELIVGQLCQCAMPTPYDRNVALCNLKPLIELP